MGKLVAVFGGSGFLGRFVVAALAARHDRVRIVCRHPNRAAAIMPMAPFGDITVKAVDILDDEAIPSALADVDHVVNLVASFAPLGEKFFNALHVTAAQHIATAAARAGVKRIVHISALSASAQSQSLYGRSKYQGEEAVRRAFPEAFILRPSLIFGPGDAFFERFASLLRFAPAFPLIGGGKTRFQPVYGGDVAAAILHCLDRETAPIAAPLALGGPRIYSFAELIRLILDVIGRNRLLVPIPVDLAKGLAFFTEKLPHALLTRDQVVMLGEDSIVPEAAMRAGHDLAGLGITATAVEPVINDMLGRFRR